MAILHICHRACAKRPSFYFRFKIWRVNTQTHRRKRFNNLSHAICYSYGAKIKNVSYRTKNEWHSKSLEMLSTAAQIYEKSHTKRLAIDESPWRSFKVIKNSAVKRAILSGFRDIIALIEKACVNGCPSPWEVLQFRHNTKLQVVYFPVRVYVTSASHIYQVVGLEMFKTA